MRTRRYDPGVRRVPTVALCLVLLLALVGCGGGSGSATGTESGAEVAPADALAFVSVNTDEDSDQWRQGRDLLREFPASGLVLAAIDQELSDENVDFEKDVLPVVGPTVELVVLGVSGGEPQLVGLTQPTDEERFVELLERGDEPTVHTTIDGWTAFSDNQRALDALRDADDKLADVAAFEDAMEQLPDEANAKAYVNGRGVAEVARREGGGPLESLPVGELEWGAFALSSQEEGWKVEGATKGPASDAKAFERALLERIPSGALVAIAFDAAGALDQVRDNPQLSQQSAQLQQLLGVGLEDLAALFGDSVFYVRPGSPFPEATLVTKPDDAQRALATLDRAAARIAPFVGGAVPKRSNVGGVDVREISLGSVSLYYGVRDGELVAATSTGAFGGSRGGPSLEDDPVFEDAAEAAGLPDDAESLLYVNIRDAIPVLEGLARADGERLPPVTAANLRALESLLGWSTSEDGLTKFSALLQVS